MAAIVEQSHDENGIIWPVEIAPYKVSIVVVKPSDETQSALANKIYDALLAQGIEPMLDDRDERVGVKFKDSELIGIPMRITVGRDAANDEVEFRLRQSEENEKMTSQEVIQKVIELAK